MLLEEPSVAGGQQEEPGQVQQQRQARGGELDWRGRVHSLALSWGGGCHCLQKWHKLKPPAPGSRHRIGAGREAEMPGEEKNSPGWFSARGLSPVVMLAYAGVMGLFLLALTQFYIPGKGLSNLIAFGSSQEGARISKVRQLDYFVDRGSDGYDSQYYVQIAMDPSLQNKGLKRAVDNLAYRARRILFCATAYVLGLGQPAWILHAYALQNVASWFLLAILLLRWFPPRNWDNFIRWAGILFSFGMCVSFRNALFDGPSLLLMAWGVCLLEQGRPGWATAVFALGGLGKETNLLGSAALLPGFSADRRAWGLALVRGILTVTPLALWAIYISAVVGPAVDPGLRNFGLPFAAYFGKWIEVAEGWPDLSVINAGPLWSLLMLVALTVQFLYLVLRPQWDKAWWRMGISYALLMVFLGGAVWEGFPGAASRVLLPMQLAFNVLVPSGRRWILVLILGNLTIFNAYTVLQSSPSDGYEINGSNALVYAADGRSVELHYGAGWHLVEKNGVNTWCWSSGSALLTLDNPQKFPMQMKLGLTLSVAGDRGVRLLLNGRDVWQVRQTHGTAASVTFYALELQPGANRIDFITEEPPVMVGNDPRPLAIKVNNLRIDLKR